MRTQVAIVGAGPAGLLLSHLLHRRGIESVVLEARTRDYVEQRVRAGVLEQGTVNTLIRSGAGERLQREGLVHHGIELRFGGQGHRIAFEKLVPGRAITVYGQQEVVKDLIAARLENGGDVRFEIDDITLLGDFATCEGNPPDSLAPGKQFTECDVYIAPSGQSVASVAFENYDNTTMAGTTVTWTP